MQFAREDDGVFYLKDSRGPGFYSGDHCIHADGYWLAPKGNDPIILCIDGLSTLEVETLLEVFHTCHGGALLCENLLFGGPFVDEEAFPIEIEF